MRRWWPRISPEWRNGCARFIAHAAELKPDRVRDVVARDADRLRLNLKLTTLNLSLPAVAPEWRTPQPAELVRMLDEFEMRSTAAEARRRYAVAEAPPAPPPASTAGQQTELF